MKEFTKDDYIAIKEWIAKRLPELKPSVSTWTENENKIFHEGLLLIDGWKPALKFIQVADIYPSNKLKVSTLLGFMKDIVAFISTHVNLDEKEIKVPSAHDIDNITKSKNAEAIEEKMAQLRGERKKVGRPNKVVSNATIPAGSENEMQMIVNGQDPLRPSILDRRPQHVSQYIHLLPEDIQLQASKLSELYLQFANARQTLERLCEDDKKSSKVDRAHFAHKVRNIERRIKLIYRRIDVAYDEYNGKVVSDEVKAALELEAMDIGATEKERTEGEYTLLEIEQMEEGEEKESVKAQRIERDKKLLRRKGFRLNDEKSKAEHAITLREAAEELHTWGILLTETQVENCKVYGYTPPSDWIKPPQEERRAETIRRNREQTNARRKAERAAKRALNEAIEKEKDAMYKNNDKEFSLLD